MAKNQKLNEDLINNANNSYPFSQLSEIELSEYLKKVFPSVNTVEATFHRNERLYIAKENKKIIGYAKLIEKDIPCPTCADVRFICGVDTNGMVKNIILINEIDLRGVKLKMVRFELFLNKLIKRVIGKHDIFRITLVDDFLKQFHGKPIQNNFFEIGKNISVITGATESSYYITQGINELVNTVSGIQQK